MQTAAEGLTGHPGVNWLILPRKAFVFSPHSGTTSMFSLDRGFSISKMEQMEKVMIRLASFASNSSGASNVPARFPNPKELRSVYRHQKARNVQSYGSTDYTNICANGDEDKMDQDAMAKEILDNASTAAGLFYFVNSQGYQEDVTQRNPMDKFWVISEEERELFSRLATVEAMASIADIGKNPGRVFPAWLLAIFRIVSSAGACGIWFGGSWMDMFAAGLLSSLVALIDHLLVTTKQTRIVSEILSSFLVGFVAGFAALLWKDDMCFNAIALSSIFDLLQGFRIVYAVIEIMSKHTVAGGGKHCSVSQCCQMLY